MPTIETGAQGVPKMIAQQFRKWAATAFLAAGLAFAARDVVAQSVGTQYVWSGSVSSDWTNAANWSPVFVPFFDGSFNNRLVLNNGSANPLVYSSDLGHTIYETTNLAGGTAPRAFLVGNTTRGSFEITGGTFETRAAQPDLIGNASGLSTILVNGGNYINTNNNAALSSPNTLEVLYTTRNATAIVTVASGTMAVKTIRFGNSTGSSVAASNSFGVINLNGGTLAAGTITANSTLPATTATEFNFNGGTLRALVSTNGFLQGLTRANINSNGAIIDTAGFNVTIGQSLIHAAGLGATSDGGLRKLGDGRLTLSSSNTFTGQTTVEAGPLRITHADALGAATAGTVVSNNARVELAGGITVTDESITINGSGGNNQGALQGAGGTNTWAGQINLGSGTGFSGTRVGGSGVLRLAGQITDNGGGFDLAVRAASATDVVAISATNNSYRDTYAVIGVLQIEGGDDRLPTSTVLHVGNSVNSGEATFDLNGFNQRVAGFVSDSVVMPMTVTNSQSGPSTLTINNAALNTFGGITNNATIGGNLSIVKTGAGTLDLFSANTYSGATIVSNGVLAMNGTHVGGGQYTITDGATLRGTGIIEAAMHSLAGSTVAPGNSIGTLTFNGDAELDGTLKIELDGAGLGFSDVLVVTGALDISQTPLDFDVLGSLNDAAYIFATYGSLVGTEFASVQDLPTGYDVVYNYAGNNIALVIPEPPAFALSAIGFLLIAARLRRRR